MNDVVISFLGTKLGVFIGVTVMLMGGAAFLMGQSVANGWRPGWQVMIYSLFLAVAAQFLIYALFQGEVVLSGLILDWMVLTGIGLAAHRITRARRFVAQYPWLYERTGWWSYRKRS
ncbi:MAG: DUF6867 family protein [Gammaproteobacteria bacterium]|jgi:hypothetical protein